MVCQVKEGSELPNSISVLWTYYSIIPSCRGVLKTSFSILTNSVFRLGPFLSLSWSSLPWSRPRWCSMFWHEIHQRSLLLRPTPWPIWAKCWQRQFDWHVFLLGRLWRKPSDCFAVVNIQENSIFSKSLRRGRINMFCHHYANKKFLETQRANKKKQSNHCENFP